METPAYLTGSGLGAPTMPELPKSEYPAEWELSHEEEMALLRRWS